MGRNKPYSFCPSEVVFIQMLISLHNDYFAVKAKNTILPQPQNNYHFVLAKQGLVPLPCTPSMVAICAVHRWN